MSNRYFHNGRRVPSVTEILKNASLIDTRWYSEETAWRGSVVHECTRLDDLGDLDESSVPPEVQGYLDAWRRAKEDFGFTRFDEIEEERTCSEFGGRPDRIVDGRVVDLKSGTLQPATAIQLAAYAYLADRMNWLERLGIELHDDGTYKPFVFSIREHRQDRALFFSALGIHNWKLLKGVYRYDTTDNSNGDDGDHKDGAGSPSVAQSDSIGGQRD